MAYTRSIPLSTWLAARRDAISTLAAAHAAMGEVDGPGRPLEIGRPVGHAYVLRVVAEFQAFARDLHDMPPNGSSISRNPNTSFVRCSSPQRPRDVSSIEATPTSAASSRTSGGSA